MTLTNHVPDQQSPETALSVSLPTVEWIPLDGLIQFWADFAHETTSAAGLSAVSSAFAALASETSARGSCLEAEAMRTRSQLSWSPRIQAQQISALSELSEACQRWIEAGQWLSRLPSDELVADRIPDLVGDLGVHATFLFRLFLRVLEEAATESGEPLRVLVGTLAVRDLEVRP